MGGTFSNTKRDIIPGSERKDLSAVDSAILENCVVMFSTTSCKYCNKAKQSLTDFGVSFKVVELDLLGRNSFKDNDNTFNNNTLLTFKALKSFSQGKYLGSSS